MSDILQLVKELVADLAPEKRLALAEMIRPAPDPIAIIGVGCRFPGGADRPDNFWRLLSEGRDAISEVPASRWDADAFYDPDPDAAGKMYTRWGGFLREPIEQFDADFFGISPREAVTIDPQQRVLLEVSWEALEQAGQTLEHLAGSATGVFVGVSGYDYAFRQADDFEQLNAYMGSGNAHSIVANRLSYLLDLRGPSLAIDTACSSSLVTVHLACQSLQQRECDLALAAGVNLVLSPVGNIIFCKARMLALDGRCKTFDARADGYVRGEGCGVVVLKRLSEALADGDAIAAIIRGSAVNQDGKSAGLTAPNQLAQQGVLRQALRAANLQPSDITYLEAHGTGTSLGDPIEVEALKAVFGSARPDQPACWLGSVKTNIGHLEAAAGIAGLIKVVLSLQHRQIPAHLNLQTLNPNITLQGTPLNIPTTLMPWTVTTEPRRAGVSSFGFGGTNAHVILEEAPQLTAPVEAAPTDRAWLLPLSARSPMALQALIDRYRTWLLSDTTASVADLCYTASVRRTPQVYRVAVIGRSREDLAQRLSAVVLPTEWIDRSEVNPEVVGQVMADVRASERVSEASLEALGVLYTSGADIPWRELYPQGGRCVALPNYPWQRQGYWLEANYAHAAATRSAAAAPRETAQQVLETLESLSEEEAAELLSKELSVLVKENSV